MKDKDAQTLKLAKQLYSTGDIYKMEVGTFNGLKQIHEYLHKNQSSIAGKIRQSNISVSGFRFVSKIYLTEAIDKIDKMPCSTFTEIINKYVEMNIAHPFIKGNGIAMRIWLDAIFREALNMVVDWRIIKRVLYLDAMQRSPISTIELTYLLINSLTSKTFDDEIIYNGLRKSFSYEE